MTAERGPSFQAATPPGGRGAELVYELVLDGVLDQLGVAGGQPAKSVNAPGSGTGWTTPVDVSSIPSSGRVAVFEVSVLAVTVNWNDAAPAKLLVPVAVTLQTPTVQVQAPRLRLDGAETLHESARSDSTSL